MARSHLSPIGTKTTKMVISVMHVMPNMLEYGIRTYNLGGSVSRTRK